MRADWAVSALWCTVVLSGCKGCGGGENVAFDPDGGGSDAEADTGLGTLCFGGNFRCEGTVATPCDQVAPPIDCADTGGTCDERLGCTQCRPDEASCEDGKATWCRPNGTLAEFDCDQSQGLTCRPEGCEGPCALNEVHDSYIGCDYYPTVTLNPVWSGFAFAIAVSNASSESTHVVITQGETSVTEADVAAGALQTFELPWVDALKGGDVDCATPPPRGNTRIAKSAAYRVRTDRPVTVYQFSPLEYKLEGRPECPALSTCSESPETRCLSYTNDASLLLPATALTGSYTALSWPSQSAGSGFVAITATEDATQVTLHDAAGGFAAGAGIDSAGTGSVMLDRGDVLELVAAPGEDVSGTRVRADKAVQVISGHSCAYVPDADTLNCDHIEEALFPEDTLGTDYVVTFPMYADVATPTPMLMRVMAVADDTAVSFTPEVHAEVILDAGEFLDVALTGDNIRDVRVLGDKPLQIGVFMEGQEALPSQTAGPSVIGDPSLGLAVPTEQFRTDYLFTAPSSYVTNIANVIAKPGTTVYIDDLPIPDSAYVDVGDGSYRVARVQIDTGSSVHVLSASDEVGLVVYGYGLYTSYMYPGGADLERIAIPVVL